MNNQPLVENLSQSPGYPENAFLFPFSYLSERNSSNSNNR